MARIEKERLIYRWERLNTNTPFAVEVEAPELTAEWMVGYPLSNRESSNI